MTKFSLSYDTSTDAHSTTPALTEVSLTNICVYIYFLCFSLPTAQLVHEWFIRMNDSLEEVKYKWILDGFVISPHWFFLIEFPQRITIQLIVLKCDLNELEGGVVSETSIQWLCTHSQKHRYSDLCILHSARQRNCPIFISLWIKNIFTHCPVKLLNDKINILKNQINTK